MEKRAIELFREYLNNRLSELYNEIPNDINQMTDAEYDINLGKRSALVQALNALSDCEMQALDELFGEAGDQDA